MTNDTSVPNTPVSDDFIRPPYAPWLTVKNFVERLKSTGVPHRIDKTVMSNLSGAAQSHLLLALRYLGLIGADGSPAVKLVNLVEAVDTPGWSQELLEVIKPAYQRILNGLDLSKATMGQLTDLFRENGKTEGTVTDKAIRFYLKALNDAGVKYSTHLSRSRGPRSGTKRRRNNSDGEEQAVSNNGSTGSANVAGPPTGMISFPIHLPGKPQGSINVPKDLEVDEVELVEAAIQYLRLYAKRQAGGKAKPT